MPIMPRFAGFVCKFQGNAPSIQKQAGSMQLNYDERPLYECLSDSHFQRI